MGDPSLLRDRLTDHDRIALETYRDARAAMALIREAIEDCAPPGAVARGIFDPGVHDRSRGAGSRYLCYRRTLPAAPLDRQEQGPLEKRGTNTPASSSWLYRGGQNSQ